MIDDERLCRTAAIIRTSRYTSYCCTYATPDTRVAVRGSCRAVFSEELGTCRAAYLKLVVRATVLIFLLVWAVLPIYWGSMSAAVEKTGNLEVWVINRDHARIGDSLEVAVLAAPSSGPGALWWRVVSEDNFPDEQSVIQGIVEERAWLAVVVNTNATNNLTAARFAGDTNYDPSSAISVYYAQARNEVVTGTYLLPIITQFLTNFTTNYSTGSTQRYLAAIVANNGTVNVTALNSVAQAPQTITPGVAFEVTNVRPYTTPVAQAPLLVGQIYICIFAFMIAMAHSTARSFISDYLTLPSYLILRIVTPLLTYLPLSLSYALISVAFKLPFNGGRFSYGAGFMAFFGFVYLGMAALGLALEAMGTLLGPRFVPLFLVLLIIVNVSTAVLPPELLPGLYSYGAGFQFWNIQQATRTILFGTYSHLGKNAGILIAWVLISCCTTALFTWFMRYWEVRKIYRSGRKGKTREGKSKDKGKHVVDEEYGPPEEVKGKAKAPSRDYAYDYQKDDKNGKNEKSERNKKAKSTISAFERWERMKNSYRNTKAASAKATSNPNFRSPSALASASHVAATRGEENPSQGSGRGEPTSHGDPDDKNRRPDDEREPDIREEEYKDEGYINKNIEENGPLDVRVRVEEVALSRTP
ncbi:hypothetical protein ACEPAG_3373 [Sanghuangporus baumii]